MRQDARKRKRRRPKPVGIRPKFRYIFESDRRASIPVPEGVRWRAEKIEDGPEADPEESQKKD